MSMSMIIGKSMSVAMGMSKGATSFHHALGHDHDHGLAFVHTLGTQTVNKVIRTTS